MLFLVALWFHDKNEAESKTENRTHAFRETNLVL